MTKIAFLTQLSHRLAQLPEHEIKKTCSFYAESIEDRKEDGMSEEEAVASLGSIDRIVSEVLADTPITALIQHRLKESHKKSNHQKIWMILAICGLPFWLPLAAGVAITVFAVYVTIWVMIASLYVFELALIIGGISIIPGMILCMQQNVATGGALIGIGLASIGLCLMTIKPLLEGSKQLIGLSRAFARKVKTRLISKKESML